MVLIYAWACAELGAELVVSNVRAAQRVITTPEDAKMVDIWYDLADDGKGAAVPVYVLVSISDDDAKTFAVPAKTFEGYYGGGQTAGKDKLITWNAGVDWDGKVSPNFRFSLGSLIKDDDDDVGAPPRRAIAIPPDDTGGGGSDTTGGGEATPSALSNRTFVDTRDPKDENLDALAGVPMLIDERPGNDRLISYEMTMQSLPRPSAGTVTVYSQIKIPNFAKKNGGWGAVAGGLGTFYGLEMTSQFLRDDIIQYKIGGDPPTPDTPEKDWKPASFDTIIDTFIDKDGGPLKEGTYYFKITLSSPGNGSFIDISAKFKSARLCNNKGEPVKGLKSDLPLWLIVHGKSDGEKSFRKMNSSVGRGTGSKQVICLDWASGSEGRAWELGNGRYFVNLGKNIDALFKEQKLRNDKVNCIGHSWGTLVGYEIGSAFGGFNRLIALDPATLAFGGYDDDRVNFKEVSSFSTGIKGGGYQLIGLYGSEAKTKTCHFSIRLLSETNLLAPPRLADFFHSLPRDWLERSMTSKSDAYWPFFKGRLLNASSREMPWGGDYGNLDGFDLECSGTTRSLGEDALFITHRYVSFASPQAVTTRATIKRGKTAIRREDWIYTPPL